MPTDKELAELFGIDPSLEQRPTLSQQRALVSSGSFQTPYTASQEAFPTIPEMNVQNVLGYNQGIGSKWGNGFVKFLGVTGTSALGNTIGFINSIGAMATNAIDPDADTMSGLWDNTTSNVLKSWSESIQEAFPTYYTEAQQKMGLESMIPFSGNANNWWSDKFLNGAGFLAGAFISGNLASGLFKGMAKNSAKALLMKSGDDAIKAATKGSSRSLIEQGASGIAMAHYESTVEALDIKEATIRRLEEQGITGQDAEQIALAAGNVGYGTNLALVGATSMKLLGKSLVGWRAQSQANKQLIREAGKAVAKVPTKFDKLKPAIEGIFLEGGQEVGQLGIARGAEEFYLRQYDTDVTNDYNNFLEAIGTETIKALGTNEGWENFILGALLGGPAGHFANRGATEAEYKKAKIAEDLINGDAFKSLANTKENMMQQAASGKLADKHLKEGDRDRFEDEKHNEFKATVKAVEENGGTDVLIEQMESMKQAPIEEVRQFFQIPAQYNFDEQIKTQKINDAIKEIKQIADVHRKIKENYPTAPKPVFDALFDAATALDNTSKRVSELSGELSAMSNGALSFSELEYKNDKEYRDGFNREAKKVIDNVRQINPAGADEMQEKLKALQYLTLERRQKYIDQWEQARKNPEEILNKVKTAEEIAAEEELKKKAQDEKAFNFYKENTDKDEIYGFQSSEFELELPDGTKKILKFKEDAPNTLVDAEGKTYNTSEIADSLQVVKEVKGVKQEIFNQAKITALEQIATAIKSKVDILNRQIQDLTLKNVEFTELVKKAISNKSGRVKLPGLAKFGMAKDIDILIQENQKKIQELETLKAELNSTLSSLENVPFEDLQSIKQYRDNLFQEAVKIDENISLLNKAKDVLTKLFNKLKGLLKGNYTALSNIYNQTYGSIEQNLDPNIPLLEQREYVAHNIRKLNEKLLVNTIIERTRQLEHTPQELEAINTDIKQYESYLDVIKGNIKITEELFNNIISEIKKLTTKPATATSKQENQDSKKIQEGPEITDSIPEEVVIGSAKKGIEQIASTTGSDKGVQDPAPAQKRWFSTIPKIDLNPKNPIKYVLKLVTPENPEYKGLFQAAKFSGDNPTLSDTPDTIVAILCIEKQINGRNVVTPVNTELQSISDDNFTDVIYTTISTNETIGNYGERYHLNNGEFSVEDVETIVKGYGEFREQVKQANKSGQEFLVKVTKKSNGIFDKTDAQRTEINDTTKPVYGTLVKTPQEFAEAEVFVATDNTNKGWMDVSAAQNRIKVALGLAYIKIKGNIIPLMTRKLTSDETQLAVDLLKLYSSGKKWIEVGKKEEKDTSQKFIPLTGWRAKKFAKKAVYKNKFGKSWKITTENGKKGFWIDVKKKGGKVSSNINVLDQLTSLFYFGKQVDKLGNNKSNPLTEIYFYKIGDKTMFKFPGYEFEFTAENIEANRDALTQFLHTKYHQVSNKLLSSDKPYKRITKINEDGTVEFDTFSSYKHYLLSDKNPDKTQRSVKDIPLTNFLGPDIFKSMYLEFKPEPVNKVSPTTFTEEEPSTDTSDFTEDPKEIPGDEYFEEDIPIGAIRRKNIADFMGASEKSEKVTKEPTKEEIDLAINKVAPPEVEGDPFADFEVPKKVSKRPATSTQYKVLNKEKALEWLKTRLPQVDSQFVSGLIDSGLFGYAIDSAIRLDNYAEEGSEFHEAFHIVSKGILSVKQRHKLYSEAAKIFGIPSAERLNELAKLYPNQSSEELIETYYEEELAEAFRDYQLEGKIPSKKYERLSGIFEYLLDKIKQLLGIQPYVKQLFDRIEGGYFADKPVSKFSKTLRPFVPGISEKLSQEILQGMGLQYLNLARAYNGKITKEQREEVILQAVKNIGGQLKAFYATIDSKNFQTKNNVRFAASNFIQDGKVNPELRERFGLYMSKLGLDLNTEREDNLTFEEIGEIEQTSETSLKDNIDGNERFLKVSVKDGAGSQVKQFFASIPKGQGEFGITVPVNWGYTFNYVTQALAGKHSFEDQIQTLENLQNDNKDLVEIVSILKYNATPEFQKKFQQAFANSNPVAVTFLTNSDGSIYPKLSLQDTQEQKVKETWRGVMALQAGSSTSFIAKDKDGKLVINKTKLKAIQEKILFSKKNPTERINEIAPYFGIEFSSSNVDQDIIKSFNWITSALLNNKELVYLDDVFDYSLSKNWDKIAEQEVLHITDKADLQYRGPDGEVRYAIHKPSYINKTVDAINAAKTLQELFIKAPWLDNIMTQNSYILRNYLFDENGNKKDKVFLSGFQTGLQNKDYGEVTTKLLPPERKAMQFNATLGSSMTIHGKFRNLIYPSLIRNSDKTLEPNFLLEAIYEKKDFVGGYPEEVITYFKGALYDEIQAALALKNSGIGADIQYYQDTVGKLGVFQDVVKNFYLDSLQTEDDVLDYINSQESNILNWLEESAAANRKSLEEVNIIKFYNGKYSIQGRKETYSEDQLQDLFRYFTATDATINNEQIKLFFNHTGYFQGVVKMFKRISGATGMKKYASDGQADNEYLNKNLKRTDGKKSNGRLKVIPVQAVLTKSAQLDILEKEFKKQFKDAKFVKEILSKYEEINEADGQGYISLDEFRELKWRLGQWGNKHEKAYQKAIKGETLNENEILYFQPQKLQYYGPQTYSEQQIPTDRLNPPAFFKFCVVPLIPSVTKMFQLNSLTDYMKDNAIGMLVVEPKVGAIADAENTESGLPDLRDIILEENEGETPMEIYYEYLGVQVDVSDEIKQEGTLGSQFKKVIQGNLSSEGRAKPGKEELLKSFEDTYYNLVIKEQELLAEELQLVKQADGNYKVVNWEKFANLLKQQAIGRGMAFNFIDGLSTEERNGIIRMKYPLDALPNRNKIENMLLSLVANKVISFKTYGGPKIEVASTGFEQKERQTDNDGKVLSSPELKFYRKGIYGETLPTQLKVPLPVKMIEILNTLYSGTFEQKLAKFNADIKALTTDVLDAQGNVTVESPRYSNPEFKTFSKLLNVFGYRIPTQGVNSIDMFEITEFLHPEVGDIAITAPELVAKVGKDFDMDKLNLTYPSYNWHSTIPGVNNTKMISQSIEEGLTAPDSGTKDFYINQLIKQVFDILSAEDNFTNLTIPNTTYNLTKLAKELSVDETKVKSSDIINFAFIQKMTDRFLSGKQGVGGVALSITNHILAQRQGLNIKKIYDVEETSFGKKVKVSKTSQLMFKEFETNPSYSLGREYDLENNHRILDILSEYANGYVDAVKDDFISTINAGQLGQDVHMYLIRRGIPVETVVYFMNQPIIREYFNLLQNNNNTLLENPLKNYQIVKQLKEKYKAEKPRTTSEYLSRATLKKYIKEPVKNEQFLQDQLQILDDYLQYKTEANAVREFVTISSKDTKAPKTLDEAAILKKLTQRPFETAILEADGMKRILNQGILKAYTEVQDNIESFYSDLFITGNKETREYLNGILTPYIANKYLSLDKLLKVANKLKADFITYLITTQPLKAGKGTTSLSNNYRRLQGDNVARSLAERVLELQKKKELKDNYFIKSLQPVIADPDYKVNGLKLLNKKLSSMEVDLLAEDLRDLMDNSKYQEIGRLILYAGIIQNGLYPTPNSFIDKLPSDIYGSLVKQVIENFVPNSNILANFTSQFFKNNWKDSIIVPYARKAQVQGNIMKADSDYLYLKNSNGDLFKQISEGVYSKTGKLGDPALFKEYYPELKESMIADNNVENEINSVEEISTPKEKKIPKKKNCK